jgi:pyruvate,water dikinase
VKTTVDRSAVRKLEEIEPGDRDLVGGKALGLGLLLAAGLPVPPAFCVTATAYRCRTGQELDAATAPGREILKCYHDLGPGPVAVRSSATVEDGATASFAGQLETVLSVTGDRDLLDAVARCWASPGAGRVAAYRSHQAVAGDPAVAVVVQRLVPAESAGVVFTHDPLDPEGRHIAVEGSWGLGEAVVSGRVSPDRFTVERATGRVTARQVRAKPVRWTTDGPRAVAPDAQHEPCLDDVRLAELAELCRRAEAVVGAPCDVEWAWAQGQFWLLQARPVTASGAAERERVRREEIAALAALAEPGGTTWIRHNLTEVLPDPTPMSWAVARRLTSAQGGLGFMYRDLGLPPDPALGDESCYDLVCGRPYCNLGREARFYAAGLPLEHDLAALKADPRRVAHPRPRVNFARAGWRFWLWAPLFLLRSVRVVWRLRGVGRSFARDFERRIVPAFQQKAAGALAADLSALDVPALCRLFDDWVDRTVRDFARESLKPAALASLAMTTLEDLLTKRVGPERARALLGALAFEAHADPESDVAVGVRQLTIGRWDREAFLQRFGHRAGREMELAEPRWAEDPAALDRLITGTPSGERPAAPERVEMRKRVSAEAKLGVVGGAALARESEELQRSLALRETARHYLMLGYAVLRKILLELDGRIQLGGGIFYLTPEELRQLDRPEDLRARIRDRRRRRALALGIEVPPAIFSDDLEAIGRPVMVPGAQVLRGMPLSPGLAEGPALVLRHPAEQVVGADRYILVCPSTDPAWVPWFVRARGLVMETGGLLSHGAVVAREFGLPAVAGLPGILERVRSGQGLRVHGDTGQVELLDGDGGKA